MLFASGQKTKGGTLSNADGKLTVKDADEVVFYVTADTDYKINFDPDFKDPKTYVGVNPEETTKQWMNNAVAQGYTALFNQHYNDYATLFNRVRLNLNPAVKGSESAYFSASEKLSERTTGLLSGRTCIFNSAVIF